MLFSWKKALCAALFLPVCVFANEQFDQILQCHTQADMPGIAIGIDQRGKAVYRAAAGMADVDNAIPLDVSHVFHIGSMSKQFTAAAILQLTEKGLLNLDDELGQHLETLPKSVRKKTIYELLTHTAGLGDYLSSRKVQRRWHKPESTEEVLRHILKATKIGPSGQKYSYSNTGYILLGAVIEKIAGTRYADYMQKRIFTPLGMTQSFVINGLTDERTVRGYAGSLSSPEELDQPDEVDRSWIHAAGAIASNIEDMSIWHRALKSGKVVSNQHYRLMTTASALPDGSRINYGMGMGIYVISGQAAYGHPGGVPGFMAWMLYFEAQDTFAIALSNHGYRHPGPATLDLLARHLSLSPRPASNVTQAVLDSLAGSYQSDDGQSLNLSIEARQLHHTDKDGNQTRMNLREQTSFTFPCTEDYYQLANDPRGDYLQHVSIYRGPGVRLYRQ